MPKPTRKEIQEALVFNKIHESIPNISVSGAAGCLEIVNEELVTQLREAFPSRFKNISNPFAFTEVDLSAPSDVSEQIKTIVTDMKEDPNASQKGFVLLYKGLLSFSVYQNNGCDVDFYTKHDGVRYMSLCRVFQEISKSLQTSDYTNRMNSLVRLYLVLKADKQALLYDVISNKKSKTIVSALENIRKTVQSENFLSADEKEHDKMCDVYEKITKFIDTEMKNKKYEAVNVKDIKPKKKKSSWFGDIKWD